MRDLQFLLIPAPKVYAHSSIAHSSIWLSVWHPMRDLHFLLSVHQGHHALP